MASKTSGGNTSTLTDRRPADSAEVVPSVNTSAPVTPATSNKAGITSWVCVPQPRLGAHGLVALMVLACIFGSVSADMYTPAMPELPVYFNTTEAVIGHTVTIFWFGYALGFLLFGPVSDKLGRRPVLIGGSALFVGGCILCALSPTVGVLVVARLVQALGAGAIDTMCTALVKDCFHDDKREAALATVQTMFVIAPILGPLLGGFVLTVAPWQAIFALQAAVGMICLVQSILFTETLPERERNHGSLPQALGRLFVVAKNPGFSLFLIVMGMVNLPFTAYLSCASYIYVGQFGLSEQVYTYFFAASALMAALGPSLSVRMLSHMSGRRYAAIMLTAGVTVGVLLLALGWTSPFAFWAIWACFAVVEAAIRPFAANVLLEQQDGDSGSVSSLYNFTCTMLGVIGSALIMGNWPTYVVGLGVLVCAGMGAAFAAWRLLSRRVSIRGID